MAALAIMLLVSSCGKSFICVQAGNAESTQTFDLPPFQGFEMCVGADVEVSQGTQSFEVSGPTNLIENLKLDVNNGILNIDYDKCVSSSKDLTIKISLPELQQASISGSGNIQGMTAFDAASEVKLVISGSGNISLEAYATSIDSRISGAGDVNLSGTADNFSTKISGSGNIKSYDLLSKTCTVKVSGSGKHEVNVESSLSVDISGSGNVYYKGLPAITTSISGSGQIVSTN